MDYNSEHIAYLLFARLTDQLTEAEQQELERWSASSPQHAALLAEIEDEDQFAERLRRQSPDVWEPVSRRMLDRINKGIREIEEGEVAVPITVQRIHLLKRKWVRYAAAILVVFGIGAYLWTNTEKKKNPDTAQNIPVPAPNEVLPGSEKAILTLSDGKKVELTPQTTSLADAGANIINKNGELQYGQTKEMVLNTMSTPRGGQYKLILSDGTQVWLNAASSITYPTAFNGSTREVSMTGEAYFQVAKDHSKPFLVKTPKDQIEVLGTHFNVNVYSDEPASKTSLLEGSVRVNNRMLKPGEAYIRGTVVKTNVVQDVAWKNGVFDFNNADLPTVFRQLSRWYDIDILYEGQPHQRTFSGKIKKNLTLSELLEGLKITGVHFRIEGKQLIVIQ